MCAFHESPDCIYTDLICVNPLSAYHKKMYDVDVVDLICVNPLSAYHKKTYDVDVVVCRNILKPLCQTVYIQIRLLL